MQNKTVLVTAAAQGIGFAIAKPLSEAGATVLATDIKPIEGLDCQTAHLDVLDSAADKETIQGLPKLDVLVNCAGFVHHGTILECDDAAWDFTFNLNVKSMFHTMQLAIPKMRQNGGGSIINISSVASSIKGAPNRFVYGASKAAIIGMTKAVAIDFIADNIRVNAICPGTVDTPSLNERISALAEKSQQSSQAVRQTFIARQPMGRMAAASEIAGLAVFLASDASAFITGQTHIIDGGWSI